MARFSLSPGESLDIVGIPDLETLIKFTEGDLGISDTINKSSFDKLTSNLSGESLKISQIHFVYNRYRYI